jgi:hypothetical protein
MVEEEDRDFFIGLGSDVHATMHAVRRLVPIGLSRSDVNRVGVAPVAILDSECTPVQNDGHSMVRVAMPGHRLAGFEAQPAHERRSASDEDFFRDRRLLGGSAGCLGDQISRLLHAQDVGVDDEVVVRRQL